jgi:Phospholipase_D-nuclease N-terminal
VQKDKMMMGEFGGFGLLFGVVWLLALFTTAFWIWMLAECITQEPSNGNDKLVWIIVLVFTHWIGAAIYFFARRPQRVREVGR